jgi:GrpB-like predicted nucleotidyltransferase (UPF0157 family)
MPDQLDRMNSAELGLLFPIILSDPDPEWPNLYESEKIRLIDRLGATSIFRIEHIGSTAVPNLKAKPTIDILLEVPEGIDANMIIGILQDLNYHYIPKPENPAPHMMFVRGYTKQGFEGQAYHIHVRYPGDWDELYFRDYLRTHPDIAREYGELKERLANEYRNDREAYTELKSSFIKSITEKAKQEIPNEKDSKKRS